MPIKIVPKDKKKKKDPKGGGPLMTPGQKKMLDKQTGRGKPMEAKSGGAMKKKKQKMFSMEGSKGQGQSVKPFGLTRVRDPQNPLGTGLMVTPTDPVVRKSPDSLTNRKKKLEAKKKKDVMKKAGGGKADATKVKDPFDIGPLKDNRGKTRKDKYYMTAVGSPQKKKPTRKAGGGSLKPVPEGNKGKGLSKLPTPVRNKMGFMKKGGKLTSNKSKIKKVTTGLKKAVKAHTGQAKMLSSIKLKKGGKVVKMRGGGAATRGMNFNRGY